MGLDTAQAFKHKRKKESFSSLYFSFARTFDYNLNAFSFFMNRQQCKFQIKPDAEFCSPGKAARLTNNPTVCPKAPELNENLWSAENEKIPHKLQRRKQRVAFIHLHLSNRLWKIQKTLLTPWKVERQAEGRIRKNEQAKEREQTLS